MAGQRPIRTCGVRAEREHRNRRRGATAAEEDGEVRAIEEQIVDVYLRSLPSPTEEEEVAFVRVARQYAQTNRIQHLVWLKVGVPPSVLREAHIAPADVSIPAAASYGAGFDRCRPS